MKIIVRHLADPEVTIGDRPGKVTVQIQNEGGEGLDPKAGAPVPVEGIELLLGESATLVVTDTVGYEPDLDEIMVGD